MFWTMLVGTCLMIGAVSVYYLLSGYYLRRTERSFKVGDHVWNYFYDECGEVIAVDKIKAIATVQAEDGNIKECLFESLIKNISLPKKTEVKSE